MKKKVELFFTSGGGRSSPWLPGGVSAHPMCHTFLTLYSHQYHLGFSCALRSSKLCPRLYFNNFASVVCFVVVLLLTLRPEWIKLSDSARQTLLRCHKLFYIEGFLCSMQHVHWDSIWCFSIYFWGGKKMYTKLCTISNFCFKRD